MPLKDKTPAFQLSNSATNDRGVSMLELALILPIIALIIFGLIEFGWALRDLQVISNAAREGARTAAAHARTGRIPGPNLPPAVPRQAKACVDNNVSLAAVQCGNLAAIQIDHNDAINIAAKKATCQYLNNAGLNGAGWDVLSRIQSTTEDGSTFQLVTVTIDRNPENRRCLICWDEFTSIIRYHRESTFALEGSCS